MNQCTPVRRRGSGPARQRGITTLVIAILLLLILSVMTALSVNVGVFEQRSAANEHRAQMVQTATEAAVNQAVEYLRANAGLLTNTKQNLSGGMNGWMFDPDEDLDTFRWQRCTTAYTEAGLDIDPCKALLIDPEGSDTDPNNKIKNADGVALYDASYRFMSGGSPRLPLSEKFQGDAQLFDDVGGFDLAYETFATMCILDLAPMDAGGAPACSLNPERKGQTVITVMARARLGDEGADAELKQTVVTIGTGLNAPEVPIIASGGVGGLGSAQIVPNPNAGGDGTTTSGIPLSVWSASDVDIGSIHPGGVGAMRSCHWGEFLSTGDPEQYDGTTICDDCDCNDSTIEAFQLSGKDPSNPSEEGEDIQDVDGEVYGGDSSLPDATFFPLEPLDDPANAYDDTLFEYTFGVDVADETSVYQADCPDSKDLDEDGNTTELIDCSNAYLGGIL